MRGAVRHRVSPKVGHPRDPESELFPASRKQRRGEPQMVSQAIAHDSAGRYRAAVTRESFVDGTGAAFITTSRKQAKGGAREKAAGKRPARRKPRGNAPVGLIVPYPFPPALIIRQTPEAHDEVRAFLNMLRYR